MAIDIYGIVANGVDTVFRVLKNMLVSGSVLTPANDYNPVTGGFDDTGTQTVVSEILLHGYDKSRIDGDIIREFDQEAIFRVSELGFELTNDRKLIIGGVTWDIVNIDRDPSETVYFLQIRRP
jgi:hypothetical protein